jgi:phage baseplate assembly protein V
VTVRLVDQIAGVVKTSTAPLRNRLANVVSRMLVDAVNDAAKRQGLRVLGRADEVLDDVEHFQPGGLSHVALPGAEGVLLCVGGVRAHPIAIGVANREARPTGLQAGETGLYTAAAETAGMKIRCLADGTIELSPAGPVPTVKVVGQLSVTGDVQAGTLTPATMRSLLLHLHPTAMGPAGAPISPPTPP